MLRSVVAEALHTVVYRLIEVDERIMAHRIAAIEQKLFIDGRDGKRYSSLVTAALVLHHGVFTAEALGAVLEFAFVGTLAGVNSAMTGTRGRLRKGQQRTRMQGWECTVRRRSACRSPGTHEASHRYECGCE